MGLTMEDSFGGSILMPYMYSAQPPSIVIIWLHSVYFVLEDGVLFSMVQFWLFVTNLIILTLCFIEPVNGETTLFKMYPVWYDHTDY